MGKCGSKDGVSETSKKVSAFKTSDELVDFETFFPAGTKSLLSKYLTKEVYDKYKGKKDKAGVSFEQMILSGSQNIDSGIGCYAG